MINPSAENVRQMVDETNSEILGIINELGKKLGKYGVGGDLVCELTVSVTLGSEGKTFHPFTITRKGDYHFTPG